MKPMNVVVEIAGRDSVVAFYRYLRKTKTKDNIILSMVVTPPEDLNLAANNAIYLMNKLKDYAKSLGHTVDTKIDYREDLWYEMIKEKCFGYKNSNFASPCLMCHVFCHIMRLPIAISHKCKYIVTGERTSHDGKLKVNQNDKVFNFLDNFFENNYGINFIRPLEDVEDTDTIKYEYERLCEELGVSDDAYEFTKCALSGSGSINNKRDLEIFLINELHNLDNFMKDMIAKYGFNVDHFYEYI